MEGCAGIVAHHSILELSSVGGAGEPIRRVGVRGRYSARFHVLVEVTDRRPTRSVMPIQIQIPLQVIIQRAIFLEDASWV